MMNRALHGRYPPGSIFKLIVAAAAIESNVGLVYDCAADGFRVSPGARPIRDYAYYAQQRTGRVWRGFGRIGLTDGFAHSANTYFAQLALACGADALSAHVKDAWLEKRLTLYAGETGSIVSGAGDWPVSETRTAGALAQLGIGQGRLLVTPLHAALWTAATAGDGHLLGPRLDADAPPVVLGRWVNAATAAQLRDLMRAVVRDGTGRGANLPGLNVGGKTGTAQTGAESHAWFICFAGRYTPVLALAVLVEHGGTGAAGALPVAVAVLREAQRVGIFETTETVAVPRNREADGRLREGL